MTKGKAEADHFREDHLQLKHELHRLDKMNINQSEFDTQMERVMSVFLAHVKEEEKVLFQQLRECCWEGELFSLGEQFESTRNKVPTHPHPYAPDKPPMETIIGMMQAGVDKTYDKMAREFPEAGQLSF